MAKEKTAVKESMKQIEKMSYALTMPDGTVIEGSTSLRQFAPNTAKGFKNSGFQVKVSDGKYSGNIMIIDYEKQERI